MNKSKIDNLCEYLNQNVAERYPISNKELSESTDYIKNGYLKMLAVVLQQSGTISDSQHKFFERIIAGAKTEKSEKDFLRMALDIEIDDYVKFSDECRDLQLKYRWVLDALILTCIHERTKEQLMLLAQFCESYDLSKDELKYIAAMAKAIIGMQVSDYVTAYEMKQDTISDIVFSDYMYLISDSCICYNDHMTIIQPSYKEEFTVQIIEKIKEISTPCIKLIGINIEEDTFDLNFCDKEKIIFEKCNFIKNPLIFESCKEVIIKDCTFENFSTRTVILNDVDNVLIDKCKFTNCKMVYCSASYEWDRLGGVIFSDRPSSIGRFELINTIFTDCGGANSTGSSRSAFISNIDSFVDNCSFKNCWHTRNGFIDPDNSKRTMFTPDSSAMNCKYEDSALFN